MPEINLTLIDFSDWFQSHTEISHSLKSTTHWNQPHVEINHILKSVLRWMISNAEITHGPKIIPLRGEPDGCPLQAVHAACKALKSAVSLQCGMLSADLWHNGASQVVLRLRFTVAETVASCTFVGQTAVCRTKVLALRGWNDAPKSRLLNCR